MLVSKGTHRTLDGIALFADLGEEARARIAQQCRWRRCTAGEQILDRDDPGLDVFFIAEGAVRVVIHSLSGREIAFNDIETGGCFGELSALDGQPRSASCIAKTDGLLIAMPSAAFRRVASDHPEVALKAMCHLARMVRIATERIMDLSLLAANNRIQAEILRLARGAGVDNNAARIHPIPIHSEVASRVSTTRETVARAFGDLARAGIIRKSSGCLVVADFAALERMVSEVRG